MRFKKSDNPSKAYRYKLRPTPSQKKYLDRLFAVRLKAWNFHVEKYREWEEREKELPKEEKTKSSVRLKVIRAQYKKEFLKDENNEWQYLKNTRYYDHLYKEFYEAIGKFFKALKEGNLAKAQAKNRANFEEKKAAGTGIKWNQVKFDNLYKPQFKSFKHDALSISTDVSKGGAFIDIKQRIVRPERSGTDIKIRIIKDDKIFSEDLKAIKKLTFLKDKAGVYYLSVNFEYGKPEPEQRLNSFIAMDFGAANFQTLSNGVIVNLPKIKKIEEKIKRIQQIMSNKYQFAVDSGKTGSEKLSKNWFKLKKKVAQLQKRKTKIIDYKLHQFTNIVIECYTVIGVEDLSIQNMTGKSKAKLGEDGKTFLRNNKKQKAGLNRSILFNKPYECGRQLEYKSSWKGCLFAKLPPYGTSSTCSTCGAKKSGKMTLSIRQWTCDNCGSVHDRDFNASFNIEILLLDHFGFSRSDINLIEQEKSREKFISLLIEHEFDFKILEVA